MYSLLRKMLFILDAETAHHFSMKMLRACCSVGIFRRLLAAWFSPGGAAPQSLWGISFSNKVGLGAGFDKNALYLRELQALGFGCVEIGTVTPLPQPGNDKPRLFRLPADEALINRMGFNNDGMEAIAERLKAWRQGSGNSLIVGGNIGKNKITPNEEAWMDYEKCFMALHPYVDYFVVNVSSPNTPGLRELQEKGALQKIFTVLQQRNATIARPRPLLLKIAPDLSNEQIDDVIALALEINLDGIVACNTTLNRSSLSEASTRISNRAGAGGLSGAPARERSTQIVQYIHQQTGGRIPIIASGGIFSAAHAREKLDAGASLVQVWTGFIYQGPAIVKNICKEI